MMIVRAMLRIVARGGGCRQGGKPTGRTVILRQVGCTNQPGARASRHAGVLGGPFAMQICVRSLAVVLVEAGGAPPQPVRVISGSMRPTLAVGEIVHLDRAAYRSAAPQIGDVVAFRAPTGAAAAAAECGVARPAGAVCPQATATRSDE